MSVEEIEDMAPNRYAEWEAYFRIRKEMSDNKGKFPTV